MPASGSGGASGGGSMPLGGGSGESGVGGASMAKKLSHPLKEIRCRAFQTLLQKLDLGFVSIAELGAHLDLVKALLLV